MPQQPAITDDVQIDSWSQQVTQELNEARAELSRLTSIIQRAGAATNTLAQTQTILREV